MQLSNKQVRWQQSLSRFDLEWECCKGCHNVGDPISRSLALYAVQAQLHAMQAKDVAGPALHVLPAQLHALQAKDSKGHVAGMFEADMEVFDSLNMSTQFSSVYVMVNQRILAFPSDAAKTAELTFVSGYLRNDRLSEMVHFAPCWNDVGPQLCKRLPRSSCVTYFQKHALPL